MVSFKDIFGDDGIELPDDNGGEIPLIPVGWYPVEITNIETVPTKAKDGYRTNIELTIVGDHFGGRKVWDGFNISNVSKTAEAIGQREFGRLARACGYSDNDRIIDEKQLLTSVSKVYVEAHVIIEVGKNGYKDQNRTDNFRKIGAGETGQAKEEKNAVAPVSKPAAVAPAKSQEVEKQAVAQPETGRKLMPWEKKKE